MTQEKGDSAYLCLHQTNQQVFDIFSQLLQLFPKQQQLAVRKRRHKAYLSKKAQQQKYIPSVLLYLTEPLLFLSKINRHLKLECLLK